MQSQYGRHSNPVWQSPTAKAPPAWRVAREICRLCGLDRTYVGGIERGERNVALVSLEKLAKALKVSLSELFRSV